VFADTSFLYALYRPQKDSARAEEIVSGSTEPVQVSNFVLLEFRQSVRLQAFRFASDRTQGFASEVGRRMVRALEENLERGFFALGEVEWPDVISLTERISASVTMKEGLRLVDILHVATAVHLGATGFLTFDLRQKKLALREGLKVPV
jgi:predicted nucleic acid-binding protein